MLRSFIAACVLVALQAPASAQTIRALTADSLSPYSRAEGDELPGFSVELMRLVAEEAGLDLTIDWVPWKRAQAMVASEPDLLLFGATRTPQRETIYEWVTCLFSVDRVFISTTERIDTLDQARRLANVGARSVYYDDLLERGFDNLSESLDEASLKKLRSGRVDAVYIPSARAIFAWTRELGLPVDALVIGASVARSDIWLAASLGYDPDIMRRMDTALARLRKNGAYAALHQRYFGDLPIAGGAGTTVQSRAVLP